MILPPEAEIFWTFHTILQLHVETMFFKGVCKRFECLECVKRIKCGPNVFQSGLNLRGSNVYQSSNYQSGSNFFSFLYLYPYERYKEEVLYPAQNPGTRVGPITKANLWVLHFFA